MVDSAVGSDDDGNGAEPLPLAGLSNVAPEVVPYVSADQAEAAAEDSVDEQAPSALDEIMADTDDSVDEDDAVDEDEELDD
jgi:hypothetical protein